MKLAGFANKRSGFRVVVLSAIVLVVLLLMWLLTGFLLSSGKQTTEQHVPRSWQEPFDFAGGSWASYTAWAARQLQAVHADVSADDSRMNAVRLDSASGLPVALAPYRLDPAADCPVSPGKPQQNGIVLMHDVQETPYLFTELAQYFRERCFVVLVPLLPGHGTQPGDLLAARRQDWEALLGMLARELAAEVHNLFLGGHGVGATLALQEAARNEDVDALILFAPVLRAQPLPWHSALAPLVSPLFHAAAWAQVQPEATVYRYESRPLALQAEVNALVDAANAVLPGRSATLPVFTVASMQDAEADPQAIRDYMAQLQHPDRQTLLYSTAVMRAEPRVSIVSTQRPELRLQGLGHEALLLPLSDRVFGEHGSLRDCSHYREADEAAWQRCRNGELDFYGEPTPELLAKGLLRKATFNLFYYDMQRAIDPFIAPVARVPTIQAF